MALRSPEPLRHRAEQRLPDPPGQVLDGDGQREFRPRPAEFLAIGIWNTPKLARMAKPSIRTTHPATSTGVIRGAFAVWVMMRILQVAFLLRPCPAKVKCRIVMRTITLPQRPLG